MKVYEQKLLTMNLTLFQLHKMRMKNWTVFSRNIFINKEETKV